MQNPGGNKCTDGDKHRNANDKEERTNAAAHDVHYRVLVGAEQSDRAQWSVENKISHVADAAADDGIEEWIPETALAFHGRECLSRSRQNHYHCIKKGAQNSPLLPIIPRQ